MASKTVIVILALAVTVSIAGATIYLIQPRPTQPPVSGQLQMLTVTSPNMEPAIMEGNQILVDKQVSPRDLNVYYPDSDIIVYFRTSERKELLVSRIVTAEEIDGKLVFYTKGDANGVNMYPEMPSRPEYDPWPVHEDLFFGKVVNTNFQTFTP